MATMNATVQSSMPYKNEPSAQTTTPRIGLPAASRPDTEYVKYHANPTASFLPFPSGQMFVGADCAVKPPSPPARTRVDPVLPWDHQPAKQNPYETALIHQPTPTSIQLAARQVMPRDLPVFTGSPEEWPIFYSSYKNSTEVCGYSDAENLARLQRCLRGNALEAVRSRLLLPSSVPYIIDTLRMLFGRPEALINSLLRRVRSCPPPKADNLKSIVDYGLAVQNMIDHMIISEQLNQLNNPMLLNELVDKLPTSLKLQWGAYKQLQADVNLATFNHFVANLQPANDVDDPETYPDVNSGHPSKMCIYCEEEAHQIASCQLFKNLTMDARWKVVRQRNLCRTCLVPHRKWPCRSKKECGIQGCQSRHHQLLHGQYTPPAETVPPQVSIPNPSREGHQNHHGGMPYTLFRYVPVKLSGNGKSVDIFAFLDEGSSTTMLETEVAEQLGIEGPSASLWLSWTGKISREEKDSKCICVSIAGQKSTKQYTIENVHTVDELNLPQQSFNYEELCTRYPRMKGLPLESYSAITPRMIIGLEHVRLLTALKTKEGGALGPVAVKTRLGWCAFGKEAEGVNQSGQIHYHNATDPDNSNQSLHDLMRTYFAVEESTVTKGLDSVDDQRALNILRRTTVKLDSNYEAGLIWKVDDPTFPDSLPMAKSRLKGLERRLARDPTLAAKVQEQIESYLRKGYAHKLTSEELSYTDPHRVWYLPLGVVVSPTKPGKIRLIWDAAAKVNGVSLNDLLLKGPDLLVPLVAVILRFRERNIAISGDISEMFHQISIRKQDRNFQRFLWRSPNGEIETYVMDVATFGASCSPCTAQFIKNQNAEGFLRTFPRAASAITKSHYVDDFLDSTDTVEEAIQLVNQVKVIHREAGFDIRKFKSNAPEVLVAADEANMSAEKSINCEKHTVSDRVLGLVWNPTEDVFSFDVSSLIVERILSGGVIPTKRQVLQVVMKLFDPLGFVSHFTVHGKILMQEIWRTGTNWDEPIDQNLLDMWYRWTELLPLLGEVKIPRCYFGTLSSKSLQNLQVHIFVDASERRRQKSPPLKPLSIPRLELQAAMIGARLMQTICSSLTLPISKRVLWSDSTTVLAWLRSDSRRYHQFIGFRVGEILSLTAMDEWRYVPSNENVADEATKWAAGPNFDPDSRWYTGPQFLANPESEWPTKEERSSTTTEELRPVYLHRHLLMEKLIDETRFSNWNRLVWAAKR
ncbi:uncharacterized protein LOC134290377 [Aedes albopictus]|uniref:Reverse transcriptase domain-containing protein n=1 Tax=Aedes albopictus TaxID=7160 RepID=A0ABM1ZEJ9_AEDAL